MTPRLVGRNEVLVTGSGEPVTLFAHGLAGSIAETRPFGSGVPGSRWFLHFRGHGASPVPPGPWSYRGLAAELRSVADTAGATRALGVSMGAGALLRLVTETPDRFERLVLVLPSGIDRGRGDAGATRLAVLDALVSTGDAEGLARTLLAEQPAAVRSKRDAVVWARRQAERLSRPPVARALRELADQRPVEDADLLTAVQVPVLVLTHERDAAHPVEAAVRLGELLPHASVQVLPEGGLLWSHRRQVRFLVSGFLSEPAQAR